MENVLRAATRCECCNFTRISSSKLVTQLASADQHVGTSYADRISQKRGSFLSNLPLSRFSMQEGLVAVDVIYRMLFLITQEEH